MAEWSNELVLEFLERYAAEPVLYDPKHPYHKNKKMINNAWQRIQQVFGISIGGHVSVSELKKKKDSLMASFRYQMRRKKEAILIGETDFKPAWFAFDFMYGFLGQIYENENEEDSEPVLEFVNFDALEDNSSNHDSPPTPVEINAPEIKLEVIEQDDNSESNAQTEKVELCKNENKKKTAFKRKRTSDVSLLREALDGTSSNSSRNEDEDDCDLYGKLIAKKLRKLTESQRERLMYEIQGLFVKISQYRLPL